MGALQSALSARPNSSAVLTGSRVSVGRRRMAGLKVFETADIDLTSFINTTMLGLKRTSVGSASRAAMRGERLLNYREAAI